MPSSYPRGQHTRNKVDRYYQYSKNNHRRHPTPLTEIDKASERRLWIPKRDMGLIIGRKWTNHGELEAEFNVEIDIDKACDDGDERISLIIKSRANEASDERLEGVKACKRRIKAILSGEYRPPKDTADEPDRIANRIEHENRTDRPQAERGSEVRDDEPESTHPRVLKNIYKIHPNVKELSEEFIQKWRSENNDIIVEPINQMGHSQSVAMMDSTKPCLTFEEAFHFTPQILEKLEALGFAKPSPIQSQLWPIVMSGHDVIGISQTGSGKTLAFLAPIVAHLLKGGMKDTNEDVKKITDREPCSPMVLVVAPARELANQIADQCRKVFESEGSSIILNADDDPTEHVKLNSLEVTGGKVRGKSHIDDQKKLIENENPVVIVGTPGRLIDLMTQGFLRTDRISFFVLDEADRLLEKGTFEEDIQSILARTAKYNRNNRAPITKHVQTVMTSATWGTDIQEIAKKYMSNPYKVQVGKIDLGPARNVSIQVIDVTTQEEKNKNLFKFLKSISRNESRDESESEDEDEPEINHDFKAIVFCSRRDTVDRIYRSIKDATLSHVSTEKLEIPTNRILSIHGEYEQSERERNIEHFRRTSGCILVATDVASRGIDVKDVTHVFNYDMPPSMDNFVHRIGRTGRAGKKGISISLFHRKEDQKKSIIFKSILEATIELRKTMEHTDKEIKKIPSWLTRLVLRLCFINYTRLIYTPVYVLKPNNREQHYRNTEKLKEKVKVKFRGTN